MVDLARNSDSPSARQTWDGVPTMTNNRCAVRVFSLVALALLFSSLAFSAQPLQIPWGPVLGDMSPTRVLVSWTTNQPSRGRVLCDGREFRSPDTGLYHSAELEGLQASAEHEYYVEAFAGTQRAQSDRYVFRTPPVDLTEWSFVVVGDTRSGHSEHRRIVDAILRVTPRPWILLHTGDLVADGLKAEDWNPFFTIERPLLGTLPFYPTLGNHEHESEIYFRSLPIPPGGGPYSRSWYYFPFANALFVVLNSCAAPEPQVGYLEQQLAAAQLHGIKWRFLMWHSPPFSTSRRGGDEALRQHWVPVIDKYGATAVFCGHDHFYEHSFRKGVHYVTTGGGGAPRYPSNVKPNPYALKSASVLHFVQVLVAPSSVTVKAYRVDGSLIEQFVIR